eukprot:505287_1
MTHVRMMLLQPMQHRAIFRLLSTHVSVRVIGMNISSFLIVIDHYPETECVGTPEEVTTIPSTGTCDVDVFFQNMDCVIETTVMPITSDSNSDSYDSPEDIFNIFAAVENADGLLDDEVSHTEDNDDYVINIVLSDATLMNVFGLCGLLVVANALFCLLCRPQKTLEAEDAFA